MRTIRELLLSGAVLVATLTTSAASAGEADFNESDIAEYGTPYFGEAKDVKGLAPLEGVRFKAQVRGTMRFFLITTDDEGRFRRNGLGTDVDSNNVDLTCEKDGYRTIEVLRRRTSDKRNAPVEVECLMERK